MSSRMLCLALISIVVYLQTLTPWLILETTVRKRVQGLRSFDRERREEASEGRLESRSAVPVLPLHVR